MLCSADPVRSPEAAQLRPASLFLPGRAPGAKVTISQPANKRKHSASRYFSGIILSWTRHQVNLSRLSSHVLTPTLGGPHLEAEEMEAQ